ncbi:protein ECERIFERUM 1-like [Asparagus officinalis]|uniref:protein ECERIFERUM 1-like n=1 Tax=Asparagus officinalis TaxID=4686 RepID=UPI00098E0E23|nr:protein ECERIFERUM 1-like [Asparagus officinalis]XP_020247926.1 protein ECERIFERUM 1-like [Asparagus officinalis]
MASRPGLFTEWPWQRLGRFKYLVLAPWVAHSVYSYVMDDEKERDLSRLMILSVLLLKAAYTQMWITLARLKMVKGKNRIVNKGLEFEQVDRETNWDDSIIMNGLIFYISNLYVPGAGHLPWWNTKGIIIAFLVHLGPVEFLYYWFHRVLHHHFLYARYHSHHHASIVTEPITSVIHPFIEEFIYFILFSMPFFSMAFTRTTSMIAGVGYLAYIDVMNYMGHCNFEMVPKWVFDWFPPLKYLMYTPSYHSLHHTQFRTNYALFMPFYDYIYGTMDKSSDELYEKSLQVKEETPNVVHLTHLTTLQSIYHLPIGFSAMASKPFLPNFYTWLMWPLTYGAMLLTWIYGSAIALERNKLKKLEMQTWIIPRYSFQYFLSREKDKINRLIEEAIMEAETKGVRVLSLGLLNQREELNKSGELYLQKHPKLKIRIVDGSSLVAAVVINSIPQGTDQVLLKGKLSKISGAITIALCQKDVKVAISRREEFEMLKICMPTNLASNLVLSNNYDSRVWLVGDGLHDEEQLKANKETHFIPFSQFPPKNLRKDCIYHSTPALIVPKEFENLHACENWLPRRVISAWRVAGMVHALEGWDTHECGRNMNDIDKVWDATLRHGFLPLNCLK